MRGDSIRDFYAKTLALLGLGVLAGTGALVDYWPSGVAMPAVESGLSLPQTARSLPVPAVIPEFRPAVSRTAAVREVSAPEPVVVELAEAPRLPVLPIASMTEMVLLEAVNLSRPAASMPVETFAASFDDAALGQEIVLSQPTVVRASTTLALAGSAMSSSEGEGHDGLITGAVKRTGTSILRTGRKTGASIVEAFRVVSGAFRRALPN
jgi:hypothetical protein